MKPIAALVLCGLLVTGAESYPEFETPDGRTVEVFKPGNRSLADRPALLAVLIGAGLFVAYELVTQEVLCPLPLEETRRPVPQWVERAESPLLYWWMLSFHAAMVAFMWWRSLAS
jgi:hypothetical protein